MLLAALLAGCQGDPLLAAGIVALPIPLVQLDVDEAQRPEEERGDGFRGPSVPTEGGGPGVGGERKETDSASADDAGRRPPDRFDPISRPEGPREGGGVKWEGVTGRGQKYTPLEAPGEWGVIGAPENPIHPSLR